MRGERPPDRVQAQWKFGSSPHVRGTLVRASSSRVARAYRRLLLSGPGVQSVSDSLRFDTKDECETAYFTIQTLLGRVPALPFKHYEDAHACIEVRG
jgi:hypothetical protein